MVRMLPTILILCYNAHTGIGLNALFKIGSPDEITARASLGTLKRRNEMKRMYMIWILLAVCCLGIAVAQANGLLYHYTDLDWFSLQSAEEAILPDGLTDREAEIYRAGYANGHYDALHPAFVEGLYVINTKTKKFHLSNCMATLTIAPENREHSTLSPKELIAKKYKPCGQCNPER